LIKGDRQCGLEPRYPSLSFRFPLLAFSEHVPRHFKAGGIFKGFFKAGTGHFKGISKGLRFKRALPGGHFTADISKLAFQSWHFKAGVDMLL